MTDKEKEENCRLIAADLLRTRNVPIASQDFLRIASRKNQKEKQNDVCIYKTLRYPPHTRPPTTDKERKIIVLYKNDVS